MGTLEAGLAAPEQVDAPRGSPYAALMRQVRQEGLLARRSGY
jgi:hypothetical protein